MSALILPARFNQQPKTQARLNTEIVGYGLTWLDSASQRNTFGPTGNVVNLITGFAVPNYDANNYSDYAIKAGYVSHKLSGNMGAYANSAGPNGLLHNATEFTLGASFVFDALDESVQTLNFRNDNQHTLDVFSKTTSSVTWGCDWAGAWNGASQQTLSGLKTGDLVTLIVVVNQSGARFFANNKFLGTKSGSSFTVSSSASACVIANNYKANRVQGVAFKRALPDALALSLSGNPWQIFQARPRNLFTASGGAGDVTAAVTGQSYTLSNGVLVPALSVGVSGQSYSHTLGTLTASVGTNVTLELTGQSYSLTQGSVDTSIAKGLTGQSYALSQGSVDTSIAKGLTGQSYTVSQGSVTDAIQVGLIGQSYSLTQGTLGVTVGNNVTVGLTGQSYTLSQGALGLSLGASVTLTGQTYVLSHGTLTTGFSKDLVGQSYTTSQGTLVASVGNNVTLTLTGQSYALSQGLVGKSLAVGLTGNYVSYSYGSLSSSISGVDYTITLAGQNYLHSQGTLTASTSTPVQGEVTLSAQTIADLADAIANAIYAHPSAVTSAGIATSVWNKVLP